MSDLNDLIATNSINSFNQGVQTGVRQEQERIIKLLLETPEGADALIDAVEYDAEGKRLIAVIKGEDK